MAGQKAPLPAQQRHHSRACAGERRCARFAPAVGARISIATCRLPWFSDEPSVGGTRAFLGVDDKVSQRLPRRVGTHWQHGVPSIRCSRPVWPWQPEPCQSRPLHRLCVQSRRGDPVRVTSSSAKGGATRSARPPGEGHDHRNGFGRLCGVCLRRCRRRAGKPRQNQRCKRSA